MQEPLPRNFLRYVNRYFMVPMFRLGLGQLLVSPLAGYIMVMKSVGRKSGVVRYAPMNYAILAGNVYCLAGFGEGTHWYRNLRAEPHVELLLPGQTVAGVAETVTDAEECRRVIRRLIKASGFAAYMGGINPCTVSDDELQAGLKDFPLVRIRPTGVGSGPSDPGGWMWTLVFALGALWAFRGLTRRLRTRVDGRPRPSSR